MNSHFLMALGRHDAGDVVTIADQRLAEVVAAVKRTGRSGTVTLEIKVSPNGETAFEVDMVVKHKAPTDKHSKSFYFSDENDNLVRHLPDAQLEAFDGVIDMKKG